MPLNEYLKKFRLWPKSRNDSAILAQTDESSEIIISDYDGTSESMNTNSNETPSEYKVVPLNSSKPLKRKDNSEVINEAFNELIDQLRDINKNLTGQSQKHHQILEKMENLPEILNSFPESTRTQQQFIENIAEEMKRRELKEQQMLETLERIPSESAKQTETLSQMNRKLSTSADADIQINENFNRFNETLARLDANAVCQTNSIMQMNRTFTASDTYMKHVITKQNRRFMWMYIISVIVCLTAIGGLTIGIFLLQTK